MGKGVAHVVPAGEYQYGDYLLNGEANAYCASLRYIGTKAGSDNLWGTVIVKTAGPLRAEGVWCQYLVTGGFRMGTTPGGGEALAPTLTLPASVMAIRNKVPVQWLPDLPR